MAKQTNKSGEKVTGNPGAASNKPTPAKANKSAEDKKSPAVKKTATAKPKAAPSKTAAVKKTPAPKPKGSNK